MSCEGRVLVCFCLCALVAGPPARAEEAPPLTIDGAVREALDHNLSILAARYNVTIAEAAVVTAGLRPNPVVTANGTFPQAVLTGPGLSARDIGVRTDYVIEGGGKRQRRVDQASAAKSVADLGLLDATRTLVLDVDRAFTDVQLAKLNIALARENLTAFGDVVRVDTDRVQAGDLAPVELARSRLAALQFENDVRQQEAKLAVARSALSVLVGRGADGSTLDVTGDLRRDAGALDIDALRQKALSARPDLLAVKSDQARSVADLRLQLANGKIDYTVSGQYDRQTSAGTSGNSYSVFLSVPLAIFNRNQGEVARARAAEQQLETKVRATETDVAADVATAYAQYSAAHDVVDRIEHDMLDQARSVRTTTEYSYRRGEASLVEFLDAVRAFNDTMQGYNEARADYARSLYELDAMSGQVTP